MVNNFKDLWVVPEIELRLCMVIDMHFEPIQDMRGAVTERDIQIGTHLDLETT